MCQIQQVIIFAYMRSIGSDQGYTGSLSDLDIRVYEYIIYITHAESYM